ncbi:endonuclease/exonuclease/phosphatase family protein [Parabacteroides sp. OttesenSCG-928-G21]|nr:endonuclease/exonuclease/phosphatase family protein [Parabacteroides sp. OttesenSCG-928-G21]
MKKTLIAVMCILGLTFSACTQSSTEKLNVMTFNIRLDSQSDGDNQWPYRKDYAANLIKFYETDLCGSQEVQHHQLMDLLERLPEYAYIGVGREDGNTKGEYTPIFYRKDRFTLINSGNFWLGEDMNAVGVKGWDAACERVATWGIFKDNSTGKEFFMLNTHLDHMGQVARREGASLVLEQATLLAKNLPIIVTGDFNATADSEPIKVLTNTSDPRHVVDTRTFTELRYGPEGSFHNFGRTEQDRRRVIDYVFVKGNFKVLRHGILTESMGHLYPSDHYPVLSTLVIE